MWDHLQDRASCDIYRQCVDGCFWLQQPMYHMGLRTCDLLGRILLLSHHLLGDTICPNLLDTCTVGPSQGADLSECVYDHQSEQRALLYQLHLHGLYLCGPSSPIGLRSANCRDDPNHVDETSAHSHCHFHAVHYRSLVAHLLHVPIVSWQSGNLAVGRPCNLRCLLHWRLHVRVSYAQVLRPTGRTSHYPTTGVPVLRLGLVFTHNFSELVGSSPASALLGSIESGRDRCIRAGDIG
mmetsp:Transcript_101970/g.218349  ORF Transcript_101970/g.218349 Transcript_101970/m.218349 type:complete len:238 (+) Transcript_101970:179-892(+)